MDEAPEEDDVGRVVFEMSSHEWNVLRYSGSRLALLAAVELHVERGGQSPGEVAGVVLTRAFARYRAGLARRVAVAA
jgi:hypothetical protein